MNKHEGFSFRLMVIFRSPDIGVIKNRALGAEREGLLIQAVFEDGVDASITGAAYGEGSLAGIFQALCAKGFFQAHDPEAGTKTLLRVRT